MRAYRAVVYLRVPDQENGFKVTLVMAKSKVSPVKTVSIPKLELLGATLLVRLVLYIQKLYVFKHLPVVAWTDSQVVLAWLHKHPNSWKTFIANRVSQIQTELPAAEWRHVMTKENPADLITLGLSPADLNISDLWWHGPCWFYQQDSLQTMRSESLAVHTVRKSTIIENELLMRYSSLTRLIRVVAYCLRPVFRLRRSDPVLLSGLTFLTAAELKNATKFIVRMSQASFFKTEIELLINDKPLPKRNTLNKLKPFVDQSDGILRVEGRLSHSSLPNEAKHPPILARDFNLSYLYVSSAHRQSFHGGLTLTVNFLQQQVWILGNRSLVKKEIRSCIICQRAKPKLATQLMGDLPEDRITPSRPFSISGLDYAGPFQLRTTKGRGHRAYKGYVALFVCFSTKAIHLEVVSDMTTASFLAAFRRFSGRRGLCHKLYSDNGSTFQGAARELHEMFSAASSFYKETASTLANDGINRSFIPPNTPHCGGLWEAGVKSTKHHLKRILGEQRLTFEEFSTLLIEFEVCLNFGPFYLLNGSTDDLEALTPAHFLIGTPNGLVPNAEFDHLAENRLDRYQLLQQLRTTFWRRWSAEYLHHLQERSKWRRPSQNFVVGQLVIMQDDRYPPSKWPLGRIIAVHSGPDGLVRVVTLKTATSVFNP
ncbi:uncharacterized protein [Prorops nasuta]|uniref:uncharacterized protein n=1 Tax=Prorops nasuta TaxID=863751 RepID=UPI0034CEC372